MWRIAKAIESLKEKQMDLMDMPSLPKEFILKSVSDSNLHPNLVTHFYPKSPISEQYRKLRENFKSLNKEKAIKVFSITSSIANEGKSITALNLAVSLTHDVDCKNVLLIDSDLRRGNIDGMLGMLPQVGLSEYLLLGADIENILFKSKINKLTIIPRGKIVENPTELLASSKMDSLLKMVREKFSYVIVDSAPVVPVADSSVVCAKTDGVVLVIRAGRTQKGIIKHANEILQQAHANILGYVLTHLEYYIPDYIYRYV